MRLQGTAEGRAVVFSGRLVAAAPETRRYAV